MSMRMWLFIGAMSLPWLGLVPCCHTAESEDVAELRPLALAGQQQQACDHALIALSRGDTSFLENLPVTAFLDPVARADSNQPGLYFRWTMSLPSALARLDDNARTLALTRLDARYRTLLTPDLSPHDRARLAISFLPAPTALANVQYAANVAFDHGRFADYLGITLLLPKTFAPERRHAVALRLSGLGPDVDASLQLVAPGSALATTTTLVPTAPHLSVRWHTIPGWVFALDPFDHIVWQYRVDRTANVVTGPGAIVVRDSQGVRSLDDAGKMHALPPLPAGAQILCIAGGAAWFATGSTGWRLTVAEGQVTALALQDLPCGAPLVRGQHSLWLTAHEFILFENGRERHRFRHQLPVGQGWQLASKDAQPFVIAPDGRHWEVASFSKQFADATPTQQAQLLMSSGRFQEAITLLANATDAVSQSLHVRARIGLAHQQRGPLPSWQEDREMGAQDRAVLLSAHFSAADRGLQHMIGEPSPADAELYTAIDALSAAHVDVQFSTAEDTLVENKEQWSHVFTASAWTAWRQSQGKIVRQPTDIQQLAAPIAVVQTHQDAAIRDEKGALRWQRYRYQLSRTPDAIMVHCYDSNNSFMWRHQWRPTAFVSAPSQNIDVRNGHVYIQEGSTRLMVLDAYLGIRLGNFPRIDSASMAYYLSPHHIACLGPLGVNNTITLFNAHGSEQVISLPESAHWACVVKNQLVVRLMNRQLIAYPSAQQLAWPNDIVDAVGPPVITADGVQIAERLWPWLPAH